MFVTVEKFTKWIEVEPIRKITTAAAVKFIRGLVVQFDSPNRIVTDNETQFASSIF